MGEVAGRYMSTAVRGRVREWTSGSTGRERHIGATARRNAGQGIEVDMRVGRCAMVQAGCAGRRAACRWVRREVALGPHAQACGHAYGRTMSLHPHTGWPTSVTDGTSEWARSYLGCSAIAARRRAEYDGGGCSRIRRRTWVPVLCPVGTGAVVLEYNRRISLPAGCVAAVYHRGKE